MGDASVSADAQERYLRTRTAVYPRTMPDKPDMQRLVDNLFARASSVSRLEAVVRAESLDMPDPVIEIVGLLPPGTYSRQQLCDQLNSAITAHGYGGWMGTVE